MGPASYKPAPPLRRLAREVTPLIDILSDPLAEVRKPKEFKKARRELKTLLSNPEIWKTIHRVKRGNKSNHLLNHLGTKRVQYLEWFYQNEAMDEGDGHGR